jgi:hypothetical protein
MTQLCEAHERDPAIEAAEGVHFERSWLDPESGKVFCLSSGPSKEAVLRVHYKAGIPQRRSTNCRSRSNSRRCVGAAVPVWVAPAARRDCPNLASRARYTNTAALPHEWFGLPAQGCRLPARLGDRPERASSRGRDPLGATGHTHLGIMWVIEDHLRPFGPHNARSRAARIPFRSAGLPRRSGGSART